MSRLAPSARSVVVGAVTGVLVTVILLTTAGAHAAAYTPSSYAGRLLALVNYAREAHGLRPLALVAGTTTIAVDWTQHMAGDRALSHNLQLGHQLSAHGSGSWRTYGENVGVGSVEDPEGLFTAYMHSPEHRANILNSDYRYVGVAVLFAGSRAWNTFDFVDVYGTTAVQHASERRTPARFRTQFQPRIRAAVIVTPRPVAAAAVTVSTPPVRPASRAARSAGPVVVHVKALHRTPPRLPVASVVAPAPPTTWSGGLVASVDHVPGGRTAPVVLALAVMAFCFAARRWMLAVSRRLA